jgi:hypothetical protein
MEIQQKDLNFKKEIKAEPQKTPATTPDTRLFSNPCFHR